MRHETSKLVTIVAVLAFALFAAACEDGDTSTAAPEEPVTEPDESPAETAEPEPETDDAEDEPTTAQAGSQDAPLDIGESAEVGDWVVTVTSVRDDADEEIADANEFNEPTPEGHVRVLIGIDATFEGDESGDAWLEIDPAVLGGDGREYRSWQSDDPVVAPDSLNDEPTVRPGGEVSGNVVIEVPAEAWDDAVLFIEPGLSLDVQQVYWSVR